jgi:hypothetical protein
MQVSSSTADITPTVFNDSCGNFKTNVGNQVIQLAFGAKISEMVPGSLT